MFVSVCASLFLLSVSNCSFCHILCCACSPWGSNLVGAEVLAPHLHFVLVYFADQLFGEDMIHISQVSCWTLKKDLCFDLLHEAFCVLAMISVLLFPKELVGVGVGLSG